MSKIKIQAAIILAILAISTASIFIKIAQGEASSLVLATGRLSVAVIAIAPIALGRYIRDLKSLGSGDWMLAISSGIFLALHFGTWISSLRSVGVLSSVVLVSTAPLWVAVISPVLLHETPSRPAWQGLALALLGIMIIAAGNSCSFNGLKLTCPPLPKLDFASTLRGNLLALTGAFAMAGYLMIGREVRMKLRLIPYIFIVYGSASLLLILVTAISGDKVAGLPPRVYGYIIALALIPQLIGHSTFNWALRYLPASRVSILTLGEPLGSAALAYVILHEIPSPLTLVGGMVILCGIYISGKNTISMVIEGG